MRLPWMTIRRWVFLIAVTAVDVALFVQRASHPLALVAFLATLAMIVFSPIMQLLFILAADD
jgi:hypothetical protein